jgi:hypothetical protein
MARCPGVKRDGEPCERIVGASKRYCYAHDPARAEARRRSASKGGKSKPSRELRDLKARLKELAEGVLSGGVDRADAAVVGQLFGAVIRAVGMELKVREMQDLEKRLEELEEAMGRNRRKEDGWRSRTG